MLRRFVLCLAVLVLGIFPAFAGTMTWKVRSFDRNPVDVRFFSQNRKAFWPNDNKVWTVKDYKVHSMVLACIDGEQICFGAWVRNNDKKQWGVGRHNRNKCVKCCYTCGPKVTSTIMDLNE